MSPVSSPQSSDRSSAVIALFPVRAIWTLDLNNAITAPPAYDGARGFFSIEQDRLVAYDLVAGRRLWTITARALSRPAAGDDLVFVAEPNGLRAVRQADGRVAWSAPMSERLATALVWDNGWLVAAGASGSISAFRAHDGQLIWQQTLDAAASAPPTLAADRVYVPTAAGRIVSMDVATGVVSWTRGVGGPPSDILAADDRLYVGSADNYLYCLHERNGEIAWRWRTGADIVGAPQADDDRVYFVALDNILRGLSRKTGAQLWKRALPVRPISGPRLVGGVVLVAGLAPPARGYRASDGGPAGELTATGELAAPPHIVHGPIVPMVVLVTRDIAKGASVMALSRSIEPPTAPLVPLPNPMPVPAPSPDPTMSREPLPRAARSRRRAVPPRAMKTRAARAGSHVRPRGTRCRGRTTRLSTHNAC
jgi:outer membrane protein assembly factor BamB